MIGTESISELPSIFKCPIKPKTETIAPVVAMIGTIVPLSERAKITRRIIIHRKLRLTHFFMSAFITIFSSVSV